jgi:uncharacterized protein
MTDRDASNRGFSGMDEDKQRDMASKGGHTAHQKGTGHEFSREEAPEAGRKGGEHAHGGTSHSGGSDRERGSSETGGGTDEQPTHAGQQRH